MQPTDPTTEWIIKSEDHSIDRHRAERAENGFSTYDYWNFSDYIAWIIWHACERFKTGHGFPAHLESMEAWVEVLEQIQAGMEAHFTFDKMEYDWKDGEATKALIAKRDLGLKLFAQYMPNMWD